MTHSEQCIDQLLRMHYKTGTDADQSDEWDGAPPPPQYLKLIEGGGMGG